MDRLLERDEPLEVLGRALRGAGRGSGRLVLVAGEAGGGKTSLVRRFAADNDQARFLWGGCDPLTTPRTLGPLVDVARQTGGMLDGLVRHEATRDQLFDGFLRELGRDARTVVVLEDVQWADDATLDLLRFMARRLERIGGMIVATFREDEVGPRHPLRRVLGQIACLPGVQRIRLDPLSDAAVAELARPHEIDPGRLAELTGGNPFHVTEVLSAGDLELPATVEDAVLARLGLQPPGARAVIEAASTVAPYVELDLMTALSRGDDAAVDAAVASGMLRTVPGGLAFRHELARRAVEGAIPALRRARLHATVLDWLLERASPEPDRIAHHAEAAGDRRTVAAYAPVAGDRAAALGAHREAVAQYARALRVSDESTPAERAELLVRHSFECYLTDDVTAALSSAEAARREWAAIDDPLGEGDAARMLSRLLWIDGRNAEAQRVGEQAVRTLEQLPPGPELARAFSNLAQLAMLDRDRDAAVAHGTQAIELAEELGDTAILTHALNNVGSARLLADEPGGAGELERSLRLALQHRLHDDAARAYTNLATGAGEMRRYDTAESYLEEGITYCAERDLDHLFHYLRSWRGRVHLERGRWDEAERELLAVLDEDLLAPVSRIVALSALGQLRVRRGESTADATLEEAWELAARTGDLQRTWPVAAARAERAHHRGEDHLIPELTADTLGRALRLDHPWAVGELSFWMWTAAELSHPPDVAADPYRYHMRGQHRRAAEAWSRIGCPYERALALADADEEDCLREGLDLLNTLGARPAARAVSRSLRDRGAAHVPRGARPTTRDNSHGLTDRQLEVAGLLVEGLTNAEIGARLHISDRTSGHHVSAILDKLGVGSRHEAARVIEDSAAPI